MVDRLAEIEARLAALQDGDVVEGPTVLFEDIPWLLGVAKAADAVLFAARRPAYGGDIRHRIDALAAALESEG